MSENPLPVPAPSRLERIATQIAAGYAAASNNATILPPELITKFAIKTAKQLIKLLDEDELNNL